MKIILPVGFLFTALALLLASHLFPSAAQACAECAVALAVHLIYSLMFAFIPMSTAGRIIGWTWTIISAVATCGFLATHAFTKDDGWLLLASVFGLFTAFLVVVFAIGFRPVLSRESH